MGEKRECTLATEMNLSETAFVRPLNGQIGGDFELRWFTPKIEVDLCGHATLASAHASARGGVVRVRLQRDRVILGGHAVTVLTGELVVSEPQERPV